MVQDLVGWVAVGPCEVGSEHAWDALVLEHAARQWDTGDWQYDLHRLKSHPGERLVLAHGSEACYAWPDPLAQEVEPAPDVPLRVGRTAGGLRSSVSNGLATTMLHGRSPSTAILATSELVGTPG